MSDSVRDWLEKQLKPILPDNWMIRKNHTSDGLNAKVTVTFKHQRISKTSAAPGASLENRVVITVTHPSTDQAQAENALDDQVLEVCSALDTIENLDWTEAEKVLDNDRLAWDITTLIYSKKKD